MQRRVRVGLVTKACELCGTEVTRGNSRFRERVFCTRSCYWKSDYHRQKVAENNSKNWPNARLDLTCTHCGKSFTRPRSLATAARPFCSIPCKRLYALANAARKNKSGYVQVWVGVGAAGADKSGNILEHRKVMQDELGRALLPHENVHHINGIRDDNRLGNLELWSQSQPSGQRVADKIRWAKDFLALYEGTPLM